MHEQRDKANVRGYVEVFRVHRGERQLVHSTKNTIYTTLQSNLRNVLISRSVEYGVDAIAWGSYSAPGGSFIASDYAGTTGSGTKGGLKQTAVGDNQAKFSGTFTFSTTKYINYFQLGRGYTAAGAAVSSLFTGLYAYDSSLLTGSTSLMYENGDQFIVDWYISN